MKNLFKKRKEFNNRFQLTSRNNFGLISKSEYILEYKMIKEELDEYLEACEDDDAYEILDAITDMLYLLVGTAYKHGLSHQELTDAYNEVHRSNMSKLHKGKIVKNKHGKILKPPTYSPPDLKGKVRFKSRGLVYSFRDSIFRVLHSFI